MSNINKVAVLNPFSDLTANILDYVPRATTSEFGIVAIGSGINVDALGRIYLDTKEYSDRLTAIETQAASSLATQQTEVAAAISQVNLTQSQTITALTLEVDNLKTNLTNRADQLAQNVTDITQQLTQDKAAFTQEIQDALVYLENEASVASALRTPRKIQSVDFDGTQDINLPVFTTELDGLVPKRVGATTTKYLREDGTWVIPPNTTYPLLTQTIAEAGTATTANTISAQVLKAAIQYHTPTVTTITGNAGTATKLQTARTIGGVSFDGTANINLPGVNTAGNQSTSGNAATATKLANTRTISLTGGVTGSVNFDGSANASLATSITGLGAANGIATLDSNGQVPSTQLPSYVDDVLEYVNVAAFPTTGVAGKIYVETTGNTTYRWSGSTYVKITSGEVASVAGKTGVVTLTKADVGLTNVDNTADSTKNVASAAKLATARTIGGVSFDGTANINLPGVNTAGNQNTSGNAGSATKLATAHTLSWTGDVTGSTSFDGTADKATALTLAASGVTAGTYKSVTVDTKGRVTGGNDVVTGLVTATAATGVSNVATTNSNTYLNVTEKVGTAAATSTGTSTQITGAGTVTVASDTAGKITITGAQSITGNAATATKLQTPRKINGIDFDGTQDINFATLPLGVPLFHGGTRATIETGYVPYDGQLLNRADHPAMWAKVQATFSIITDADWLANPSKRGSYSSGDGTATFRMPDYNGVQTDSLEGLFLRGDGGGTIGGVAVSSGTVLSDAIRNITGTFGRAIGGEYGIYETGTAAGPFVGEAANPNGTFRDLRTLPSGVYEPGRYPKWYSFDASRVVPTAAENRPVSAVGVWICRVGSATTEVANPTLHAVLTGGNVFSGSQAITGDLEVSGNFTVNGVGMFGTGQIYRLATTSKIAGVTYTNTDNKLRIVHVNGYTQSGSMDGYINDQLFTRINTTASLIRGAIVLLIPPGYTYKVGGFAVESWWEFSV